MYKLKLKCPIEAMGQGSCEKPVSQEKKRFQWRRIILKSFRRAWKAFSSPGNRWLYVVYSNIWYYRLESKNNQTKNKNESINNENNCYIKIRWICHHQICIIVFDFRLVRHSYFKNIVFSFLAIFFFLYAIFNFFSFL